MTVRSMVRSTAKLKVVAFTLAYSALALYLAREAAAIDLAASLYPDINSERYWNEHHVCVMRVSGISQHTVQEGDREMQITVLDLATEERLSDDSAPDSCTIPRAAVWVAGDGPGPRIIKRVQLAPNERLLVYFKNYRDNGIGGYAVRLTEKAAIPKLVADTREIAKLRRDRKAAKDASVLKTSVFSSNAVVSLYCLKTLNSEERLDAAPDYLARLERLRDDVTASGEVRWTTCQLVSKTRGRASGCPEEREWLIKATTEFAGDSKQDVDVFVTKLVFSFPRCQV